MVSTSTWHRGSIFAPLGSNGAGKTTVVMVNGVVGLVGTYVHVGSSPSSSLPPESCVEREQPLEWKGEERTMGERSWASGHWRVKDGKTEEFIQQWDEWLTQSSAPVPGFHHAKLLRSLSDPNLFTSISEWDNAAARDAWKASPGFQEGFTASQALCDEFVGGDYDEVVVVSKPIRNPG